MKKKNPWEKKNQHCFCATKKAMFMKTKNWTKRSMAARLPDSILLNDTVHKWRSTQNIAGPQESVLDGWTCLNFRPRPTNLHCKSFASPGTTSLFFFFPQKEKWLFNLSCLSILICCQWALHPLFPTQPLSSPSTTVRTCDWLVVPQSHRTVNRIEIGRKMISVHLEGDKRVFFFSFIRHWSLVHSR